MLEAALARPPCPLFQRFEPDPKVVTVIDKAGRRDRPDLRNPRTSLEQRNGLALIVVIDDGPRVSDDDLVNLGQRGRRLDEQTPGHGLGLAIVREIVARYEGETSFSNGSKGGLKVLVEVSI